MSDLNHHWQKVYRDKSPDQVSWFQAAPQPSLDLITKQRANLGGLEFIDVGAGASTLVDSLLDLGLASATLLDISAEALAVSRARLEAQGHQDLGYLVQDISQWQPDRAFDIWHDRAVFHFMVTPEAQAGYRRALMAGTRPGSLIVLATFALDGPEKCSGLPVQRWGLDSLQAFLGEGFHALESQNHLHSTPGGVEQKFQFSVFERQRESKPRTSGNTHEQGLVLEIS